MTLEHRPRAAMTGRTEHMSSRNISGNLEGRRQQPAFIEWELRSAEWIDTHPHDEFNFVLEGSLHVESGGVEVVAGPGDLVRVTASEEGRYFAPTYARMLAIYDHNPDGTPSLIRGMTPLSAERPD